jgi:hypothetical protein
MLPRLPTALILVALGPCQALSEPAPTPPDLDCTMGFDALHNWAAWLPGAERKTTDGQDVVTVSAPNLWRVEITFTQSREPAQRAVVLRKFLKQVTGVWTAQSKACGYGDKAQFDALMSKMRAEDTRLTNASRADVERQKREQSPLGSQ